MPVWFFSYTGKVLEENKTEEAFSLQSDEKNWQGRQTGIGNAPIHDTNLKVAAVTDGHPSDSFDTFKSRNLKILQSKQPHYFKKLYLCT